MKEKFIAIAQVLSMIETKGEHTMLMADCLRFINQCVQECEAEEKLMMSQQNDKAKDE